MSIAPSHIEFNYHLSITAKEFFAWGRAGRALNLQLWISRLHKDLEPGTPLVQFIVV